MAVGPLFCGVRNSNTPATLQNVLIRRQRDLSASHALSTAEELESWGLGFGLVAKSFHGGPSRTVKELNPSCLLPEGKFTDMDFNT